MKINILDSSKVLNSLEIQPFDNIKDIKMKIQDLEGIPVDNQNLYLGNKLLKDSTTVLDYEIKNNDNLRLDINPNKIIIFFRPESGRTITLETKFNETIENIKKEIESREKFKKEFQILKYKGNNLSDKKTLEDYKITNNSYLELCLNKKEIIIIPIFVELFFEKRKLCLNIILGQDRIKDIKEKIRKLTNIPISDQKLFYKKKYMDDEKPIEYYDITIDSAIKLYNYNEIMIKKKILEFQDKSNDSVNNLKKKKIENEFKFENLRQLLLNNAQIYDNKKTLDDCSIKNKSDLNLCDKDKTIYIFIKTEEKGLTLETKPSARIKDIKSEIYEKKGIIIKTLTFGGKIMHDDKTLADYNVQNSSTLFTF